MVVAGVPVFRVGQRVHEGGWVTLPHFHPPDSRPIQESYNKVTRLYYK